MQGFIQVFAEREWTQLPTLGKRVLAVYVLGFQFFQAFTGLLAPVGLALALAHKAPVAITLLATVPLGLSLLTVAARPADAAQFGRTFGSRVRLRDYVGLVSAPTRSSSCCRRPRCGRLSGSPAAATTG